VWSRVLTQCFIWRRIDTDAQIAAVRAKIAELLQKKGVVGDNTGRRATVVRGPKTCNVGAPPGHVGGMTHEQLAYELLLDRDFKLDEKACTSNEQLVYTKIREVFETVFWVGLVDDLANEKYDCVLSVLDEIVSSIQRLTVGHVEHAQIAQVINVDDIRGEAAAGRVTHRMCLAILSGIEPVLVSVHKRTNEALLEKTTVEGWVECRDAYAAVVEGVDTGACARALCASLQFFIGQVHCIAVGTANRALRGMIPVIMEHGVDYIKSHFDRKLACGILNAELPKIVALVVCTTTSAVADDDTMLTLLLDGNPEAYERVFWAMYVNVVSDYTTLEDIPETMQLDYLRIRALNAHLRVHISSAVVIATVGQKFLGHPEHDKIMADVIETVLKAQCNPNDARCLVGLTLVAVGTTVAEECVQDLKDVLDANACKTSDVYQSASRLVKRLVLYR
jgi:hypothetical protein